jgi:hypothetical protein
VAKTAFHWGFIPTVLYLGNIKEKCFWQWIDNMKYIFSGFTKGAEPGMPPLSFLRWVDQLVLL